MPSGVEEEPGHWPCLCGHMTNYWNMTTSRHLWWMKNLIIGLLSVVIRHYFTFKQGQWMSFVVGLTLSLQ